MTEQSTFGGTAVAEPPAPELPESFDDGEAPDNRRRFMVLGAALGAVLLLVAAYFLLFKGGSAPADTGIVPPSPVAGSSSAPNAAGTGADHKIVLPKKYNRHVGRDPFKPLFVAAPADDGSSDGSTTDSGSGSSADSSVPPTSTDPTTTGTTTVPTGSTGTGTTPTGGSRHGSGPSATPRFAPVWIELVSTKGTKSASFIVEYSDGKTMKTIGFDKVTAPTDKLRTRFGHVFALLSIHDRGVTVQFGDGTPFDLKKGLRNRHYVG